MAHLKPEVTPNLRDEVVNGRTAGPFPSPLFENQQVFLVGLFPKKHSGKSFTCPSPNLGPPALNITLKRMTWSLQYITTDNTIAAIYKFVPHCFMAKTDRESAFRLFPVHPNDWELLGMFCNGFYNFEKVFPFWLRSAPFIFNQLSDAIEWILLNNCSISFAVTFWITSLSLILLLAPGPLLPFETNAFEPNWIKTGSLVLGFQ